MQNLAKQNNIILSTVEHHLSSKFGLQVSIESANSIGGGCINNALKIKTNIGDFFLKWNANGPADIFIREAESLNELKKATGDSLQIPEVVVSRIVDNTPGFLVQEYFPIQVSNNKSEEQLGRGLAIIHKYKNENFGFYNNNYCGATTQNNTWKPNWVDFFSDNRLRFLLNLINKERPLPVSELKVYEKLLGRIPKLIPDFSDPVLIHGDLWSGNYMISTNGPVLIDPASYFADREMEFAIITMFGGFSSTFYSAYNETNPLPADWRNRNLLYQLYHVLNHYYLFGGAYQNQALAIAMRYL